MSAGLLELGIAAVSVAAFARPVRADAARHPAPADHAGAGRARTCAPQPPAIASLLGNGWDLTEDAAEATLLDLGGRRLLEFRQPANDPFHTTIHIADQ